MDSPIIFFYIIGTLAVIAIGIIYKSLKKYEIIILAVAISPWISALFNFDMTKSSGISETTYGSYIRVSLILLAGVVGFLKYIQHISRYHEKLPIQFKLLLSFSILAILSTLYSLDPFFTFVRAVSFSSLLLFLLGYYVWLLDEKRIMTTFDLIFWLIVFITSANLASLFLLGNRVWLDNARFSGLWSHPNMLGSYFMVTYPILLWKFLKEKLLIKLIIIFIALISLYMHILTGSRTSFIASVFGIILFLLTQRNKIFLIMVTLVGLFAGTIVVTHTNVMKIFKRESGYGESITTLTGRTDIWRASYLLIKEKPIEGYGFAVGGKIFSDYRFYNPKLTIWSGTARLSLHNGYLDIAVGVGVFGLLIWIILLNIPYFKFLFLIVPEENIKALLISIMTMMFVTNLVESSIEIGTTLNSLLFWFSWVIASKLTYSKTLFGRQIFEPEQRN